MKPAMTGTVPRLSRGSRSFEAATVVFVTSGVALPATPSVNTTLVASMPIASIAAAFSAATTSIAANTSPREVTKSSAAASSGPRRLRVHCAVSSANTVAISADSSARAVGSVVRPLATVRCRLSSVASRARARGGALAAASARASVTPRIAETTMTGCGPPCEATMAAAWRNACRSASAAPPNLWTVMESGGMDGT